MTKLRDIIRADDASYSSSFRWSARVAVLALLCILAFLGLMVWWGLQPAKEFKVISISPLVTDEYTSEGIPVIRRDSPLIYTTHYEADAGVEVYVDRWLEVYGTSDGSSGPAVRPFGAIEQSSWQFFSNPSGTTDPSDEPTEFTVSIRLNPEINSNTYYSLVSETSYQVNPIRKQTIDTASEVFLYLSEDAEIP